MTVEQIVTRGRRAFEHFGNWHNLCQAQAEIFYPERATFTHHRYLGEELHQDIFDGEPVLLRRDCANQLGAMLRRRGEDWFEAKVDPYHLNDDDEVASWLEDVTEIQRNVIYAPRSYFTEALNESDNDYVTFGASVLKHTYNSRRTGLLFACAHLVNIAWYDGVDDDVDEVYERIKRPVIHFAQMFGAETLPMEWRRMLDKPGQEWNEVTLHRAVIPIERYAYGKKLPRQARFGVCYYEESSAHMVASSYFRTFPYLVRRWSKVSGESIGRSPVTGVALADGRMLNQAAIALIDGLEKAVGPPLIAPDEGVSDVQLRANSITTYDPELFRSNGSRPIVDVIPVGRLDYGMEYAAERRGFLGRAFLQNLLKLPPVDGKVMTAYEVEERIEEFLRNAAPVLEPMEAENGVLMEGVFERIRDSDGPAHPWGPFDDPPEVILDAEVRFEFDTPLSQARRRRGAQRARAVNGYVQERAAVNPGIQDLIDNDEMDREALAGIGSMKWVRSRKDVSATREEKQKQAAMAQMANLAMSVAGQGQQDGGAAPRIPVADPLTEAMTGLAP